MNQFRNILWVFIILSNVSCSSNVSKKDHDDWKNLFNGKNLNDWKVKIHHHKLGDNYANTFRVTNEKIQVMKQS